MPKPTKHVTYVEDGEHFALVTADHGGGKLNLLVKLPHGWESKTSVPHREPGDYDASGGNVTWKEPS